MEVEFLLQIIDKKCVEYSKDPLKLEFLFRVFALLL